MDDHTWEPEPRRDKSTKIAVILIVISILFSFSFVYFHLPELIIEDKPITIYDVSELRELEVIREVPVEYMSREDFKRLVDLYGIDFTERELILWDQLFLFPIEEDLETIYLESYGEGVAGYYSYMIEEVVIIEGGGHMTEQLILAHEFTHALQDQHYSLQRYRMADNDDLEMAKHAVYEGDAMFTMYEYLFSLPKNKVDRFWDEVEAREDRESELPYGIESAKNFPYLQGYDFIREVYEMGGWDAVDRLYTDRIPMSTEQILHVDKYFQNEAPMEIDWKPSVEGMIESYNYTVGEFMIYTMLDQFVETDMAYDAAEGWGGDKLYYFESIEGFVSIFTIEWDTPEDALEFYDAHQIWQNSINGTFEGRLENRILEIEIEENNTTIYYSDLSELPDIYP